METMMEDILERECDEPADWQSNSILERDGNGNVLEVIVPDDEDGEEDKNCGADCCCDHWHKRCYGGCELAAGAVFFCAGGDSELADERWWAAGAGI